MPGRVSPPLKLSLRMTRASRLGPMGVEHRSCAGALPSWRRWGVEAAVLAAVLRRYGDCGPDLPESRQSWDVALRVRERSPPGARLTDTHQPGLRELIMSILAWIVVGLIAGWLAERIAGRSHGLLTNLIVGIIGAFIGGFIFSSLLGFRYEEGFNLPSIVVATVGAVVLLAIFGGIRTRSTSL
jgi:uncharacterized membrane protein YeaQ/YmgE (transglycosylase-associated protein family)